MATLTVKPFSLSSTAQNCSILNIKTKFIASNFSKVSSFNSAFGSIDSNKCRSSHSTTSVFSIARLSDFKLASKPEKRSSSVICNAYNEISGRVMGIDLKIGVVVAKFNEFITKQLLSGALETFIRHGVESSDIDVVWVPGSFEIPLTADTMAKSGKYDAILCIGAVIRGSTSHYDAVVNAATSGVLRAGMDSGVPCIFGVLTCDTMEQAIDRAGGKAGNKGSEAAITAIETATLLARLKAE